MCRTMVDIQSVTAEIRRGKKERKKKKDKNIMSASATQGGHNNSLYILQQYISDRTTVNYNLRARSRNKALIPKTADLNERNFFN